jgi:hypothetical protein
MFEEACAPDGKGKILRASRKSLPERSRGDAGANRPVGALKYV